MALDYSGTAWSLLIWSPVVIGLGWVLLRFLGSLCRSLKTSGSIWKNNPSVLLTCGIFVLSACVALRYTWYYMLKMVADDMQLGGDKTFAQWFFEGPKPHRPHTMIFEAYQLTSLHPGQWWITSQLMLYAVTFTSFIYIRGYSLVNAQLPSSRSPSGPGIFVWLGFLVALSFGLPLFVVWYLVNSADSSGDINSRKTSSSPVHNLRLGNLFVCMVIAAVSTVSMHYLRARLFNFNLVFGHLILILPFLLMGCCNNVSVPSKSRDGRKNAIRTHFTVFATFVFIAAMSLAQHIIATYGLIQFAAQAEGGSKQHGYLPLVYPPPAEKHLFQNAVSLGIGYGGEPWNSLPDLLSQLSKVIVESAMNCSAQMSVTMDVVFITIQTALFIAATMRSRSLTLRILVVAVLLGIAPVLPMSIVFPAFLAMQEYTAATEMLTSDTSSNPKND